MAKTKKNILFLLLMCALLFTAGIFVGCGGKTQITSSGQGEVIHEVDENENSIYTARAEEWNEFLGWYEGEKLYSKEESITLAKGQHKTLEARFGSSGEISFDRVLNSLHSQLSSQQKEDYLLLSSTFDLTTKRKGETENYTLSFNGSVSLAGKEHIFHLSLKDSENNEKIGLFCNISAENSKLYLTVGEEKFSYDLPIEFKSLTISDQPLTLESLSGTNYVTLQSLFGIDNQLLLFEDVENIANKTKLTIRIDKFLDYLKNIVLPNLAQSDVWVRELIETFTKKYQGFGRELPSIKASLEIDYDEGLISSMRGNLVLAEDYKLELEDTYTIKASSVDFEMTSFEAKYSSTPQEKEDISSFPAEIEVLNASIDGQINFLQENIVTFEKKVIDSYAFSLNSDLNLFALTEGMAGEKVDWSKIDWANLGYLNLRISLIEDEENLPAQQERHNGETEFVNLLIDTQKYGANMLVYAGLYNPQMNLISENYILNNTFHLPKIMSTYSDSLPDAFPDDEQVDTEVIANAIKGVIAFILASDNENINEVIFKFLEGLASTDEESLQILKNCFTFDKENEGDEKDKIILKVDAVKEVITEAMSQFSTWLGYSNFTDNLFGPYTTHISFDFTSLTYGKVTEEVKTEDTTFYNQKHTTILSVKDGQIISGVDDATVTAETLTEVLDGQLGKDKTLEVLLSDGQSASTFEDYMSDGQAVILTIHSYEVVQTSQDDATVLIYFTYCQGTFAKTLYNHDIPYGLIACERTLTFA